MNHIAINPIPLPIPFPSLNPQIFRTEFISIPIGKPISRMEMDQGINSKGAINMNGFVKEALKISFPDDMSKGIKLFPNSRFISRSHK